MLLLALALIAPLTPRRAAADAQQQITTTAMSSQSSAAYIAPRSRLGLSVGSPQTIALTYEYAIASPLQLQVNAGTAALYSAASGRLLVVPDTWRFQPYAFVGGGALYSVNFEDMDGDGWTGFTWFGGGLRLRLGPLLFFGELGKIANLNESKDYDSSYGSAAVGILVQF